MKTGVLLQWWPYCAIFLFVAGMIARYTVTRESNGPTPPWRFDARGLFGSVRLLCLSLSLLLLGHFAGLLFPQAILLWNSNPSRLHVLEGWAFGIGVSALGSCSVLMWRYLRRPHGSIGTEIAETVFLSLLSTTLLSGSLIAGLFRWGSSWGVLTLTPYVLSLLRGRPAVELATDMPFLVRLHVFSAFAMLVVLPATGVAPLLIAVLRRGLGVIFTPIRNLFDAGQKPVRTALRRLNLAMWIWPEED